MKETMPTNNINPQPPSHGLYKPPSNQSPLVLSSNSTHLSPPVDSLLPTSFFPSKPFSSFQTSSTPSSSNQSHCEFPPCVSSAAVSTISFTKAPNQRASLVSTTTLAGHQQPNNQRTYLNLCKTNDSNHKMSSYNDFQQYMPNPFPYNPRPAKTISTSIHPPPTSSSLVSPLSSAVDGSCSLVWSNLTYSVSDLNLNIKTPWCPWKQTQRIILDRLSGHINSGELVALIGPSGVGKSSLLEILAGRRRQGVHGDVHLIQRVASKHTNSSSGKFEHLPDASQSNVRLQPRFAGTSSSSFHHNSMPEASISFISQHDHHLDMLTVRETLLYASQLKNAKRARQAVQQTQQAHFDLPILRSPTDFHKLLVHSVLSDLGLIDAQHTSVGRCSGGQRRRLSIALELLSQPRLILMDEPTTGLDFVSAFKCIQTLRSLTLMPHPPGIITSIHQPSSVVLSQFHRVYTLAKGGRCMFEGQVHSLVPHLNDFRLRCPMHFNPADFAIQVASGDFGLACVTQLAEHQRKCHEHAHQVLKPLTSNRICVTSGGQWTFMKQSLKRIRDRMNKPTGSYASQINILIRRSWKCTWRQPTLSWLRVFQFAFTALLIANLHNYPVGQVNGCFSDLQPQQLSIDLSLHSHNNSHLTDFDTDSPVNHTIPNSSINSSTALLNSFLPLSWSSWISSWFPSSSSSHENESETGSDLSSHAEQYVQHLAKVKDNSILLFFSLMFWVMSSIVPVLLTFPAEMRVFRRERANGWYSCFSYYTAKILVDTPMITICPLLFCLVFFPLTGQLAEWWRFALFYSVAVLLCLIAQTLGLIVGAAFADDRLSAVFIGSVQSFPFFMVGGYLIRGSVVSALVRPLWQFGYVRFAFSALILSVYGFGRCPSSQTTPLLSSASSSSSSFFSNNGISATNLNANLHSTLAPHASLSHAKTDESPLSRSLLHQVRNLMDEEDFNCLHDSYYTDAGYQVDQLLGRCNLSLPVLFARQPLEQSQSSFNSSTANESSFVLSYYEVSSDSFVYNMLYLIGTLIVLQFFNYLLLVRSVRKEVRD